MNEVLEKILRAEIAALKESKERLRQLLAESMRAGDHKATRMSLEWGPMGEFTIIICSSNDDDELAAMELLLKTAQDMGLALPVGKPEKVGTGNDSGKAG
jgi:hypothetical protein